jgi:CBS domain-containing protein
VDHPEVTSSLGTLVPASLEHAYPMLWVSDGWSDSAEGAVMLVGEIMTSPAVTVRDDASPHVAMSLLARRRLTLLPVVNAQGRLVGVLSEADLLSLPEPPDPRAHLRRVPPVAAKPQPRAVAELMTSTPQTTSEQADVAEVAALFRRTAWKCLPVMHDGEVVGVVSRSDIIQAMSRDDDDIEDDVKQLLKDLGPGWEARVRNGVATISGPGPEREGDAAASLAATVMGIRAIRMAQTERQKGAADKASRSAGAEWSVDTWVCPPSSGTGVDQL